MNLSWDSFRFILVLHRHRTLSGAARELGVDQSTASRWLKTLEREVGAPVFRLEDRRYQVTPSGRRWVKLAEGMEQAYLKSLPRAPVTARQRIRLTTLEFLLNSFILPHWKEFGFDPSIHYEFETSSRSHDLKSTRFDFALRLARPEHLGPLKTRNLGSVALGRVAAKGCDEKTLGWVELEDEMQSLPEQKAGAAFREGMPVLQVSSYLSVLEAIQTGRFMGMLPLIYLKHRPSLKALGPHSATVRREVWVLMKESYAADPCLREFLDRLVRGFKEYGSELG